MTPPHTQLPLSDFSSSSETSMCKIKKNIQGIIVETASLTFIFLVHIYALLVNYLPEKFYLPLTLLVSFLFYGAIHPLNFPLLLGVIVLNYFFGFMIHHYRNYKLQLLISGLLINLFLLFAIKCFFRTDDLFFQENNGVNLFLIAMGSSFYLIQAMGYLFDTYYNRDAHEKNPLYFALFISFFPQLVMGPIERSYQLIDQFKQRRIPPNDVIKLSSLRIFLGLFKKVIFADTLYSYNAYYLKTFAQQDILTNIVSCYMFMGALYAEFSGYTDIALGTANMTGIKLHENFNRPIKAWGATEFFSRWNITFYSWLNDYVTRPFIRVTAIKNPVLLFLFLSLVSGLWHRPNLSFICWGISLFFIVMIDRLIIKSFKGLRPLRYLTVLTGFIFATIFFSAESFPMAVNNLIHLLEPSAYYFKMDYLRSMDIRTIVIIILYFSYLVMEMKEIDDPRRLLPDHFFLRNMVYILSMVFFLLLGKDQFHQYLYTRF